MKHPTRQLPGVRVLLAQHQEMLARIYMLRDEGIITLPCDAFNRLRSDQRHAEQLIVDGFLLTAHHLLECSLAEAQHLKIAGVT